MPLSDFWLVFRFWGTVFLFGAAAFPLTRRLFHGWPASNASRSDAGWFDEGYFFSKAVGIAVVSWFVYVLGTLRIAAFGHVSIIISLVLVFLLGFLLSFQFSLPRRQAGIFNFQTIFKFKFSKKITLVIFEEIFFFSALLFWSWVKAHEPSIRGLEKFMDYGFMQSILNSRFFPPADMWYAGEPINYYYFGHLVTAVLTKLSGLDLAHTFNLMLATIFALCFTMSFSIGYQLITLSKLETRNSKLAGGILTAFLVTLAGNLQTIYAFTRGYVGENVVPFWNLFWSFGDFWSRLPEGLERYWYANATRFIPLTIHEFPSYSFVVSDVHGHVLSIPFALLAIALLIAFFSGVRDPLTKIVGRTNTTFWQGSLRPFSIGFYGFLVGVLLMTNALDGLIYLGLLIAVLGISNYSREAGYSFLISNWKTLGKKIGVVVVAAGITSLPFLYHFKSFVSGIAVNCPLPFLANTNVGPLIFEGVEKCQRSPVWMWLLLWGFFLYCGGFLVYQYNKYKNGAFYNKTVQLLLVFFFFSVALVIFPEFFYFKDIYPAHFRSNTMFKLGYQAFILFSIVSAYVIMRTRNRFFFLFLIPQLFLVSMYPIFSVRSYFNGLKNYEGIYGLGWLSREYPDDYTAINWLNRNAKQGSPSTSLRAITTGLPVLIEADGDSYTDYNRFSAFTGIPTVVGWAVHEWLWRDGYDKVAPRRDDVRLLYESTSLPQTREIVGRYGLQYVIVGSLEREKYPRLIEDKFRRLGTLVFSRGETRVYDVAGL